MLYIIICWENVYEETLADFKKLGGETAQIRMKFDKKREKSEVKRQI